MCIRDSYKITHEFNGWKYIQDTSKDHAISFVKCANLFPGCYHDIDGMKNMFFDLPENSIVYGDSAYTGTTMKKFAESQL